MQDVVIAGHAQSSFHFANKDLPAAVRGDDIAVHAVRGLAKRIGIDRPGSRICRPVVPFPGPNGA